MWSAVAATVLDFVDHAFGHQAAREQFDSALVHPCEELFSVVIDKTDVGEVHRQWVAATLFLPALIQLIYARSGELAFKKKPRCRRFVLCCNSDHVRHLRADHLQLVGRTKGNWSDICS